MNYSAGDISVTSWGWDEDDSGDAQAFRRWRVRYKGQFVGLISVRADAEWEEIVARALAFASAPDQGHGA